MTSWSLERKKAAAFEAPMGRDLARADTRYVERPGWFQIVTPSALGGSLNEIYVSQVDDADAERTIDEAIATYRAHGQPVKWCVGPWTRPADLGERLTRRGFRHWDVRSMGRDTGKPLASPPDVRVEEVDASLLDAYLASNSRGWSMPPDAAAEQRARFASLLVARPRNVHLYVAGIGDAWLGTAATIVRGDYAYLMAAQVEEAASGRGLYRALVAARMKQLHERGVEYAVSHAREATSAPMLEHLGFETLDRYRCYLLEGVV
jgi:GNAT superfamily N-acetyltransferase